MEQHAIPRDITGFQFKLIGPMTLRQFMYLVVAALFGYLITMIVGSIVTAFYLDIASGLLVFCVGLAFAFIPVNDRPLDYFLKNLYKKLTSPTQFVYHKENLPLRVLEGMYYEQDPHVLLAHVDSREKLAAYIAAKNPPPPVEVKKVLPLPLPVQGAKPVAKAGTVAQAAPQITATATPTPTGEHPWISGVVQNRKHIPLPGVLIYIKDVATKKSLRILKTNSHGVFASFHPLPPGEYLIETVDTAKGYVFDPLTTTIDAKNHQFTFVSREMMS